MFDKLKEVEAKYNDISERLTDPAVISDNDRYKKLMREHKQLTPIIDKFHEYEVAKANFDEAKAALKRISRKWSRSKCSSQRILLTEFPTK